MRTLDLPAVKKLRDGDLLTLKGHTYEFLESDPHGLRCLKLPGRELVTLDSHSRFTRQVGAPLRVIGTAEARRLGLLQSPSSYLQPGWEKEGWPVGELARLTAFHGSDVHLLPSRLSTGDLAGWAATHDLLLTHWLSAVTDHALLIELGRPTLIMNDPIRERASRTACDALWNRVCDLMRYTVEQTYCPAEPAGSFTQARAALPAQEIPCA